jgi:hypothetical protein
MLISGVHVGDDEVNATFLQDLRDARTLARSVPCNCRCNFPAWRMSRVMLRFAPRCSITQWL